MKISVPRKPHCSFYRIFQLSWKGKKESVSAFRNEIVRALRNKVGEGTKISSCECDSVKVTFMKRFFRFFLKIILIHKYYQNNKYK